MPNLSAEGTQLVQRLAQRHGLSDDAVIHMLVAVNNGNGTMAQFSHPEFGGSGQWMRGGMTMVSDLFNHQLKFRVDSLCNDIAGELANHQKTPFSGSFQSQSQNGMDGQSQAAGAMGSSNSLFVPDPTYNWWPSDLGAPSAIGSQNNVRYAYFAQSRRLAVSTGDEVWLYDTMDHQIGGFSQQQGIGGSITFTSQFGTVKLSTLPVVSRNGVAQEISLQTPPAQNNNTAPTSYLGETLPSRDLAPLPTDPLTDSEIIDPVGMVGGSRNQNKSEDIIDTLDRLGGLLKKGFVTDEEFAIKKRELLDRL